MCQNDLKEVFDVICLRESKSEEEIKKELKEIEEEIEYYVEMATLSREEKRELKLLREEKRELKEELKNVGKKLFLCKVCHKIFWAKDIEEAKKLHTHIKPDIVI